MIRVRHKFGPSIDGTYPRPSIVGELDDVEVDAVVSSVKAGDNPGEVDLDILFTVPPHDLSQFNQLLELHAVAYPPGHGVHTDPKLAIKSTQPKSSAMPTNAHLGGNYTATIKGVPSGAMKVCTVLGFNDPTPDPSPASTSSATTAPAPASDGSSDDSSSSAAPTGDTSSTAPSDPASADTSSTASSDPTSSDASDPTAGAPASQATASA